MTKKNVVRTFAIFGFAVSMSAFATTCDPEPTSCDKAEGEAGAETSCDGAGQCPDGYERDCLAYGTPGGPPACQTMCMNCECMPSGGSLPGPGQTFPQ